MKKERIEITKANNSIDFYLTFEGQRHWLFSQEYSMSVYKYFKFGRSVQEIMKHNCWRTNPRLAKTIDRIPAMVSDIRKEYKHPAGVCMRYEENPAVYVHFRTEKESSVIKNDTAVSEPLYFYRR